MIAASVIRDVERLIAEGLSSRQIARRLPVSRETVRRVAAGQVTSAGRGAAAGERSDSIPPTKCPRCGGKSSQCPCRLCFTNASDAQPIKIPDGIEIGLQPAEQERLEAIRRNRQQREAA